MARTRRTVDFETVCDGRKFCMDCQNWVNLFYFPPAPKGKAGKGSYCLACQNKRVAAWRERRKEAEYEAQFCEVGHA